MENSDSSHIEADGSESGVLRGLKWTHGSIFSRQSWTLNWLSSSLWGLCEYLIVTCSSQANLVPWFFALDHSNSATSLAISGPATIHLWSAPVFSVRPTAPSSPLTSALICSCALSNEMAEKGWTVFLAVNAWHLNSWKTYGHLSCKDNISCTWTGNQRA